MARFRQLSFDTLECRRLLASSDAAKEFDLLAPAIPSAAETSSNYWYQQTGANNAHKYSSGHPTVIVAVLDTGVDYTHPELYKQIWINPGEIPAAKLAQLIHKDNDGIITFHDLNDSDNAAFVTDRTTDNNNYIEAGDLIVDPTWANGDDKDGNGRKDDLVGWNFDLPATTTGAPYPASFVGPKTLRKRNDPMDFTELPTTPGMHLPADVGHGTGVAGMIAAAADGQGIVGVAPRVLILPIVVTSGAIGGGGSDSEREFVTDANPLPGPAFFQPMETINDAKLEALAYVQLMRGAPHNRNIVAVNLSFIVNAGYDEDLQVVENNVSNAIKGITSQGTLVVQSAGNQGQNFAFEPNNPFVLHTGFNIPNDPTSGYRFPIPTNHDVNGMLIVGGTESNGSRWGSSNYHPLVVDVMAPARDIKVLERGGGTYDTSGTSFSAPQVAGTAAALKSLVPSLPMWNNTPGVKNVRSYIMNHAASGAPHAGVSAVRGVIDVDASLQQAWTDRLATVSNPTVDLNLDNVINGKDIDFLVAATDWYEAKGGIDAIIIHQRLNFSTTGSPEDALSLVHIATQQSFYGDVRKYIEKILMTHVGDANLDGHFNSMDLVYVFGIGEYNDAIEDNSGFSEGDFDGDGDFTAVDLAFALAWGSYES